MGVDSPPSATVFEKGALERIAPEVLARRLAHAWGAQQMHQRPVDASSDSEHRLVWVGAEEKNVGQVSGNTWGVASGENGERQNNT